MIKPETRLKVVSMRKTANHLKGIFGKLREFKPKSNKPTEEILKEIDKELDCKILI